MAILTVAALVWSALPTASAPPPRAIPRFESAVELVRLSVVVRDRSGAAIRGLTREDFVVTEDDKPQVIESFDFEELPTARANETEEPVSPPATLGAEPAPPTATPPSSPQAQQVDAAGRRLVVLLFDTNSMEPEQLARAIASARTYIEARMTASDVLAVAVIASGLQVLQDFTADRALLDHALDRVSGADDANLSPADPTSEIASDPDAFAPDTSELDLFNIDRRLRAIEDLSKALAPVVQKKSVVYFSSGYSGVGADNQVQLRAAIDRAVKANLSVYPVDVRGLEAVVPGGEARQASTGGRDVFSGRALGQQFDQQFSSQDTLASLASDTGGRAFFDVNEFSGVFERVVQDSAVYYVLGYASTNHEKDGRFRRIKVRLRRGTSGPSTAPATTPAATSATPAGRTGSGSSKTSS